MAKVITKQDEAPQGEEVKVKVQKPPMKNLGGDDKVIKVNLDQPVKETVEQKTTEEQPKKEDNDKVIEEVQEKVEEKKVEEKETEKPVLEEITDEKKDEEVVDKVEAIESVVDEAVEKSEQTGQKLPENIQKVIDFMDETGGDLEDYVKLNQDYSKYDDTAMLREYYRQSKPHLNSEEIDFLIEDSFTYDAELDDPKDIKRKKLAFKEQVANARTQVDGLKSKYYAEIKAGSKLSPEQQKAIDFFNRYNEDREVNDKAASEQKTNFLNKTNNVFTDKFKGFEYNVGDKRFRINVKDANAVKNTQSDINNFVSKFLDKRNMMQDAMGYHKSIFTAMNADSIASHFYEQGKADGIKDNISKAKNINMEPRQGLGEIETSGVKVRVVEPNSTSGIRWKTNKFNK